MGRVVDPAAPGQRQDTPQDESAAHHQALFEHLGVRFLAQRYLQQYAEGILGSLWRPALFGSTFGLQLGS